MEFQFSEYFMNLFTIPIIIMIIGITVAIGFLYDAIFLNKLVLNKRFIRDLIFSVFFTVLFITGINQFNYKIVNDDISNSIITYGEIETIKSVKSPPRFHYSGDVVMPKEIDINGETYYIMTIGDFEVGDIVVIEFLPNSYVIMSINYD